LVGRGVTPKDRQLHATLEAAQRPPRQVQPVDLTDESLNARGARLLIGIPMALLSTPLLASAMYAVLSYRAMPAYDAAPVCSTAPAADCRSQEPVVVTANKGTAQMEP
jgi:hypothetical protein